MPKYISFLAVLFLVLSCSSNLKKEKKVTTQKNTSGLEEVATFKGVQVTGVAVSSKGRLFASFPRWREGVPFSVVEVMDDGSYKPYPDEKWNSWSGEPQEEQFTSVQSVFTQGNYLYVLDPSSPQMKGVVGNAKLFRFNLETDTLDKTWVFNQKVAPKNSYLNDLRIDTEEKKIFISDSGIGGLVVIDMQTNEVKRLLDKHPSTKAEDITLVIDEEKFSREVHSDGIAISPLDDKLYYQALTGHTLYRVPTDALETDLKHETQLVKKIENLGTTSASDGMVFDNVGNLYKADLERNAISYRTPKGEVKTLVQDQRLEWPDTLTIDEVKKSLIFSDSLLGTAEVGKPVDGLIFKIYRVSLPEEGNL